MNNAFLICGAALLCCLSAGIADDSSLENSKIIDLYCLKEKQLIDKYSQWKSVSAVELQNTILEIGRMRSKKLVNDFLDKTEINPTRPAPQQRQQFEVAVLTSPKVYSAGPESSSVGRPFFEALLRIGVSFSDSVRHCDGKTNGDELFKLTCLAQISGGAYFNAYYYRAITNRLDPDATYWISKVILPAPLARVIPEIKSSQKTCYDKWQDILIARFKSQLASGDAEIADTIYTMGFIRSDRAMPLLIDNLTVGPQISTNAPAVFSFPAAEALISIAPPLGICFEKLDAAAPMSPEESLWLRITHEVYPEALEYDLMKKTEAGEARAKRLLRTLPWRRLEEE